MGHSASSPAAQQPQSKQRMSLSQQVAQVQPAVWCCPVTQCTGKPAPRSLVCTEGHHQHGALCKQPCSTAVHDWHISASYGAQSAAELKAPLPTCLAHSMGLDCVGLHAAVRHGVHAGQLAAPAAVVPAPPWCTTALHCGSSQSWGTASSCSTLAGMSSPSPRLPQPLHKCHAWV